MKTAYDENDYNWFDLVPYWTLDSVRRTCVKHNFFQDGEYAEYWDMLAFVVDHQPTSKNLYIVARNICEHSEGQTIADVIYILVNEALTARIEVK